MGDPEQRGDSDDREARCQKLLLMLERECPGLVPAAGLEAGALAHPVLLSAQALEALARLALGGTAHQVVWQQGDSEVLVHVDRTQVRTADGHVLIGLTLESDQTGAVEVVVPFAVGSERRPAGMLVVTEQSPRGPEQLVDLWGDAIIAAAWQVLLDVTEAAARLAGQDRTGRPLRAGALIASGEGVRVVPQAQQAGEVT